MLKEGNFGIGMGVHRSEDNRLVTGRGRYTADLNVPGQCYAAFVRSPHAHARILSIDVCAALNIEGVIAVFTKADLDADSVGLVPHYAGLGAGAPLFKGRNGTTPVEAPWQILAGERVRHVGQEVALVVARTELLARDAAEAVSVEYEPTNGVSDVRDAVATGAPLVWDTAAGNVAFDWAAGDETAVENAFQNADHVVKLEYRQNRLVQGYLEPRSALVDLDAKGRLTLYCGAQHAHRLQRFLSEYILKIPPDRIRVVSGDVGGGFGGKLPLYNEYSALSWAAMHLGRPIKWTCDRTESFLVDIQARDHCTYGELALSRSGDFLAVRATTLANVGAFLTPAAVVPPTMNSVRSIQGVYRTPLIHYAVKCVFTNTAALNAYRGAGRPEGTFLMERLIDEASHVTGIDPIRLRRRNLIRSSAMPHSTSVGTVYDSGDFERSMDMAVERSEWKTFQRRKKESKSRGMLRGIGIANYIEGAGGVPSEFAEIRILPNRSVEVLTGSNAMGQGIETSYAQVAADFLQLPFENIRIVAGDTDRVVRGEGSYATRSMRAAGNAIRGSALALIEKASPIAARMIDSEIVDYDGGRFRSRTTNKSVDLFEIASSLDTGELPSEFGSALSVQFDYVATAPSFPNGTHVCEVEIDPETGVVKIVRYTAIDDVGRVINPLICHGQIAGGIAQGIGQALLEDCSYDRHTGQLLTASFMDYCLPRAGDLLAFDTELNEVHSPTNPLGVKGAGEGGTTGSIAAVANAVHQALYAEGVKHIDMPFSSERILRALGTI